MRVARQAGLDRGERMAGGGELVRTVQAREGAPRILAGLDVDDHDAGDGRLAEPHQGTTLVSGEAVTKRPPQSRMKAVCAMISSFRFQGRISSSSGLISRTAWGARIGRWLPGRKRPCLAGLASNTATISSVVVPQ